MFANLFKSILHNIGVLIVGFIVAFIGSRLDLLFGFSPFHSLFISAVGYLSLAIGFLLRVWATFYFYRERMSVIVLKPQKKLFTSGPYAFSRNPLYLGGNVFIFFGAALVLGTPGGIILTIAGIVATEFMIRREEKQLAQNFGKEWIAYKNRVRQWI